MKIAVVYDRVNKIGGAERILTTLHSQYPQAPLYTAVYHPPNAAWAKGWDIRPSFLNRLPLAKSTHELYPWLAPLAFESFDLSAYQVVISVTSAEAKGVITKPNTLHLCYCLTPTRYLWQDYQTYLTEIPRIIRPFSRPFYSYLRKWDKIACHRPDIFLAISKTVQARIRKYYHRDSEVIYPPVDCRKFTKLREERGKIPFSDYYLVVSRLVAYKRIELAILACNRLKKNLVVVGTGFQFRKLKKLAGPTIYFTGKLTEEDLVLYYQHCNALLFPQEEDFGMTIVEAQAAGKPVIAYRKGGAREIILEGQTGLFFPSQSADSLATAIRSFERIKIGGQLCLANALRFDKLNFTNKLIPLIEELWKKQQKNLS